MSYFYNLTAKTLSGEELKMETYKGKTIIIVNTASKCGLTPQYEGLEELYKKYKNQDLVILGFPCNQFGNQEPGDADTIKEGCLVNYGVSFPMFAKVDVNGDDAHPIFKYLKSQKSTLLGSAIKWNFEKFVINKEGEVIKRFLPIDKPSKIEKYLLKEGFIK